MKTVVIDGVEYVEVSRDVPVGHPDNLVVVFRPIPPKQKTIMQVAAEAVGCSENRFKELRKDSLFLAVWDYIEQRLQALEKKMEGE